MEWRDVEFTVGERQILRGITGMMEPGRVAGIMGPSGCGKTTLLNVLSGRQKTSGKQKGKTASQRIELKGSFYLRGELKQPAAFQKLVAYVFQDNALPELETPRDCMRFSAFLRLPRSVSAEEREAIVDSMLERLKLENCSDVIVGSVMRKGLSGGEQKRTAVGIELISSPRMVFLDEPLSGLDSYNAYSLMTFLRDLARSGVTVLLTLHQPSAEIFALLDDLIVMHDGEVCYHGPADGLDGHFELLGFPCPEGFDPTDHVLSLVQHEPSEVVRRLKDQWLQCGTNRDMVHRMSTICPEGEDTGDSNSNSSSSSGEGEEGSTDSDTNVFGAKKPRLANRHRKGCLGTLAAIMSRDFRRCRRDLPTFVSTYVLQHFIVALGYSMLFFGIGRRENDPSTPSCAPSNFNDAECLQYFLAHLRLLSMVCFCVIFASVPYAIQTLQLERSVFLRERSGDYYGVIPYFFSKMIVEIPQVLLENLAILIGTYWCVGLHGNFLWLLLELELLALTSSSMMYIFSAACSTPDKANSFSSLPLTLQFAFSGVIIPLRSIPVQLRWLKWLCPLYYGLGMLSTTEFRYLTEGVKNCEPGDGCLGYQQRLEKMEAYGLRTDDFWWPNVAMSVAMIVVFRLIAGLILWRQSRFLQ